MRGKTSPLFPSFLSSLSRTALTYSRGPEFGRHGSFGLPAATQPCRVGLRTADVRGNGQRCHVLPDTLRAFFICTWLHLRTQAQSKVEQRWCFCQSVSPKERSGMTDMSAGPRSFTPKGTILWYAGLLYSSMYSQTAQASDGGQA